jgi:hypothetical protein
MALHVIGAVAPRPRSFGKVFAALVFGGALFATAVAVAGNFGWLPELRSPFGTTQVDRTEPAVLQALEDLSEYHAARGNYQLLVNLEEDVDWLPDEIAGERTLFQATGSVDAIVDLAGLDGDAVSVSADGSTVTITLPEARLSEARVDPEHSQVVDRERGLLDRLGGVFSDNPTDDQDLYVMAGTKLTEAAQESGLTAQAEANTEQMLRDLLEPLGFEHVDVLFVPPPESVAS